MIKAYFYGRWDDESISDNLYDPVGRRVGGVPIDWPCTMTPGSMFLPLNATSHRWYKLHLNDWTIWSCIDTEVGSFATILVQGKHLETRMSTLCRLYFPHVVERVRCQSV